MLSYILTRVHASALCMSAVCMVDGLCFSHNLAFVPNNLRFLSELCRVMDCVLYFYWQVKMQFLLKVRFHHKR